jgi:hypothetical protein
VMKRLLAHREEPVPVLSGIRKGIPPQIDAIFQKMVAKKKADRYPSMTALIADLTDWKNVSPSAAPARSSPRSSDEAISDNVINAIFDD